MTRPASHTLPVQSAPAATPGIAVDNPFARTRLAVAIIAVLSGLALVSAILFQAPQILGAEKALTDFDAFHVAGRLALEGRAEDAYRVRTMLAAQNRITGTVGFMPWTYPPPFTMLVKGLAILPIGLAFMLFIAPTFALYLVVVRRIAGALLPGVLIVMLPTLLLMMRTGQNGFLTGGLIGLFLLAHLARRAGAGLPLGLMVLKPHLAMGITLITLMERRWAAVAIAAVTVLGLLLVSTLTLGLPVWQGFADGVRESSGFLRDGHYRLFRMTSLYATTYTLGAGPALAMAVHAAGALAAITLLVLAWRRNAEPRLLAAIACCTSLFVSPYNYDYDLTILGLAAAFVLPDLLQRTRPLEQLGLVLLAWSATGYGMTCSILTGDSVPGVDPGQPDRGGGIPALMAPLLLLLIACVARALQRAPGSSERVETQAVGLARP